MGWFLVITLTTLAITVTSSSYSPFVQQKLDRVGKLPGQSFGIKFQHYSGYVTVNDEAGRALFYWFMEADQDPQTKPLLLWLNGGTVLLLLEAQSSPEVIITQIRPQNYTSGPKLVLQALFVHKFEGRIWVWSATSGTNLGPGCSSIAYGEAEEIGPFHINPDGKTLYLNPHSWNQVANVLFLDSPVGVGFSYSNTSSDILNNGDKRTAEDSLTFLLKWFERFPQYKGRDFFVAGESYAGHYVPQLSQAIVKHNSETKKNAINLKGYLVGNALTDDFHDHLGVAQFMWASGLISDQTYKLLNQCDSESFVHPSNSCGQVFENADVELGNIDPYSIFTSLCPGNVSQTKQLLRRKHRFGRLSEGYDPCTEKHSTAYFNLPEVQKALHVDQDHKPSKWETCSEAVNINWKDSPSTVLDVYHELIGSGLRIWMFSGDTDSVIPVTSTRYSIDALKLPTVSPWRPWYDEGQVGGWTQEYDGLTFVAVRGAGHEVPLHRPKLALSLFKAFIAGTSMPTLQLVSDS